MSEAVTMAMTKTDVRPEIELLGATVRALLNAGASVDARGADEETALHKAARAGFVEQVRCLLLAGGRAAVMTRRGTDTESQVDSTPLGDAISMGHTGVVKLLVEALTQQELPDQTHHWLRAQHFAMGARAAQKIATDRAQEPVSPPVWCCSTLNETNVITVGSRASGGGCLGRAGAGAV